MNEETFNTQLRKYLKKIGMTTQQEIEKAVQAAIDDGRLNGTEELVSTTTIEVPALDLVVEIRGDIALE